MSQLTGITVRPMVPGDWPAVEAIYREGIASGQATFDVEPPSWAEFDAVRHPELRLVAADARGVVVGWVAASPTSSRPVYRGVVEHSVYVATSTRGQGVGGLLLRALLDRADACGVWTVQASLFPENASSLRLHAALGFRVVGRRERIAHMSHGPLAGTWRDTILIERRSPA
ncbi:GNAT family N-acetyltransferase [Ruania rhizosphaerae]|uniref:GNAT family N-acetyltransferase n=1 Tax=Ruania rhizosphaerae TaxID=1840413 RepID=UPI001F35FE7B|nr:GNAT family N-acetyltransferase [Ruania rhizosphaerae]